MRALDRKLMQDLARLKVQGLAIALVIGAAVALYVGTAITARALRLSEERYYAEQRFAHIWSGLSRAPDTIVARLAAIPGVAAADGRLVAQGVLDLPGVVEPATGLFLSIPARPGHVLNDVYIRRGRHVELTGANEVLVSEAFADRNGLVIGTEVGAVLGGQHVRLRIVGIALSPEFIMQVPPGGLVPDDRRFGVFWMARERMADLLDARHVVNSVAVRLSAGGDEAVVIAAVDRLLDPFGGTGAFGRGSQPSHVMLESHIAPVAALAVVVPSIFLLVAMFLVNVVLSRLVATDRAQIGMLKAFGYSTGRLVRHYLLLVFAIAGSGLLLGLPIGVWLGRVMSTWFATFFRFPVLVVRIEPAVVGLGSLVITMLTAVGAVATLAAVVRMPPIVAMTPPAPTYRASLVDRLRVVLVFGADAHDRAESHAAAGPSRLDLGRDGTCGRDCGVRRLHSGRPEPRGGRQISASGATGPVLRARVGTIP
jgi:putative ABC transport system permease protein